MVNIVGHRGAEGYAPENTLLSFQKAIDCGCQRTELDVWLTKDDQLVVLHNSHVDKISNGHGWLGDKTLEEIEKLHCPKNQHIPTLQQVVDVCKGKIDLQIELKGNGTPAKVNDIIMQNMILDNVLITSFKVELLEEISRINPKIKLGLLFHQIDSSIWEDAKKLRLKYLCPEATHIDKDLIDKAHQNGFKVYAWHVNDLKLGQALIDMGIDDIGTNFPKMFLK